MNLPPSPFKGLAYFGDSDTDARFFFGRERESELVAANLMASRLTVLYGPSGVGKSSLLRAGVARRLRTLVPAAGSSEPGAEVVIVDRWRDDPVVGVATAAGARTDIPLTDALAERAVAGGGELYLVLDQMEEYVLYHGRDGPLAAELEDMLTRSELPIHVLLGVRDDALADLDALKRRLPGLFGNLLRRDHLTRAAARTAIDGPLRAYAELGGPEVSAEDELVEAVLDEVAAGRIERHLTGRGLVDETGQTRRVETPYLQLVLERLWEIERERGSDVLRAATLAELGGAERIVEQHLERALQGLDEDQRDLAARLFNHLVTPSGTKIAYAVDDLARYAGVEPDRLGPVLATQEAARILRRVPGRPGGPPRYEIFHDVLAGAVLAWRGHHETERRLELERVEAQRRFRRLAAFTVTGLVAFAVVAAIAVYALSQRAQANEQERQSRSRALTNSSLLQLDRDPELALLLAREAEKLEPSRSAENALRSALIAFRTRSVVSVDAPIAAAAARGAVWAVDGHGVLHGGGQRSELDSSVSAAAFDADARLVVVSGPKGVRVRDLATGVTRRVADGAAGQRLALARTAAAIASRDGRIQLVELPSLRRSVVRVPTKPTGVAIRRDGGAFAVTNGHVARVFDARGRLRTTIDDRATLLGSAISRDGKLLATAAVDSAIRIWELPSGRLVNVMLGHRNFVTQVAFTSDALRLVSASLDGTSRSWDVSNGRLLGVLTVGGAITSVATTPDGRVAVTSSGDDRVRLWQVEGDPRLPVRARVPRVASDLSVDAEEIRAQAGRQRYVIDRRTGRVSVEQGAAAPPNGLELNGNEVSYSRSGRTIVLRGHTSEVMSARFSADRSLIVTASRDHDARIWNAATGRLIHVLLGHFAIVSDASFSPDRRWVVTAGPWKAGLFDVSTGELIAYLQGHEGILTSAVFDPTGRVIVTTGADRTVRSWLCYLCLEGPDLVAVADQRLGAIGRQFTADERRRYLVDPDDT